MRRSLNALLATCMSAFAASGCACKCPQESQAEWEQYQQKVQQERQAGHISPSLAQTELRDEYRKRFGMNPEAAGFYAFSISLLRSAEHGDFPLDEAEVLIRAREVQMVATQAAQVPVPRPEVNDASQ